MQLQGQLRTNYSGSKLDRLLLLFMCENDPGGCCEWEADSGANAVIPVPLGSSSFSDTPKAERSLARPNYAAQVVTLQGSDYDVAANAWRENSNRVFRDLLGQFGGEPSWLQGDETPICDACHQPKKFVAQLEEGPDSKNAMNFGGGCAYVFECTCVEKSAKMLWQC